MSCKTQRINAGQILMKTWIIDEETKKPRKHISEGHRYWYSLVIGESTGVYYYDDSSGASKEATYLINYIFLDLRTKHFYEYLHFSDTAVVQAAYLEPESVSGNRVAYMYKDNPSPSYADSLYNKGKNLTDTVIDNKLYGRFRYSYLYTDGRHPLTTFTNTVYFDCKANSTIKLYKVLSERRGCPAVRFDQEFDGIFLFTELTTTSKKLTSEESKVFDTWEKYAKEHPVK